MTAYVLYDNVLNYPGATVTYSNEVDNSGPFAHDNLLHNRWIHGQSSGNQEINVTLPSSADVDTWAIFGHNLADSGVTVALYYGSPTTFLDSVTPSDNSPIFRRINTGSRDNLTFRILSPPDAGDQIYHIAIGKSLQLKPLNVGFSPPTFDQYRARNSVNRHGAPLGRSVSRVARDLRIQQNAIAKSDFDADFIPFLEHAARYPFLFCWDYENSPEDTVFCWLDDTAPDPVYSNLCHLSLDMRVKALRWDGVPST